MMRDESFWINSSEVGEYVYCARSWRLRAEGYETAILRSAQEAGIEWHAARGDEVSRLKSAHTATIIFTILSVLVLLILIL